MFIAHYGVAIGVHAVFPSAPLPVLMVATQAIDFVWAGLVLADVEKVRIHRGATKTTPLDLYHIPYSHSLLGALIISAACAVIVGMMGLPSAVAWTVLAVTFSHWVLDLLVHDRTLVLIPGRPKIGFGLWEHPPSAIGLEFAIILGGGLLYFGAFGDVQGAALAISLFTAAALLVQAASFFGPPPKTPRALTSTMLVLFILFTFGSFWLDQSALF